MSKHTARKRFGQHFLSDGAVIDRLIQTIAPKGGEYMVEIGPGLAALTQPLVERLGRLTVVELDRDLVTRLEKHPHLHVVEADVLTVDFLQLLKHQQDWAEQERQKAAVANEAQSLQSAPQKQTQKLRVVGNLPYNISTPILFHLLNFADIIEDQHFMLQKEVVDRMVAQPCTSAYGRLTVMLQWRYEMDSVFDIGPESFSPPPKVNSSIVAMYPHKNKPEGLDFDLFAEMVKVAFSQKRKIIRHSLGRWLESRGFEGDFDLKRRAEEVPVKEYIALAQALL